MAGIDELRMAEKELNAALILLLRLESMIRKYVIIHGGNISKFNFYHHTVCIDFAPMNEAPIQ